MVKKYGKLRTMNGFFKVLENMKRGDEVVVDGIEKVEIEVVDDNGKVVEIINKPTGKATFVRGHYRRVNGKRVYVRPHYRNKPNPARRKK